MRSFCWRVASALILAAAPRLAVAADLPASPPPPPPTAPAAYVPQMPNWIVTVGVEGRIIPEWPGAANSKFGITVLPLFSVRKEGTPPAFFGPRDSFGFAVLQWNGFELGPALLFLGDRQAQNYKELYGLGSVGYTAQIGAFANWWLLPWLRLRGEVRQGIGGETGVTGDVFLDAVVPLGQWTLSGGPRMTMQTTAAVSPYFSITAAQSAATALLAPQTGLAALPAYNASGGIYSYGAGTQVQYRFNPQWELHTFVEYQRLTGSAADSPIVTDRGSANQFTYGLGGTYSFDIRPWW